MFKKVIVETKILEGDIKNGSIVYMYGEPFLVIDAQYRDEKGEGVIIESIYNDKVKNFELEKIKSQWKHNGLH